MISKVLDVVLCAANAAAKAIWCPLRDGLIKIIWRIIDGIDSAYQLIAAAYRSDDHIDRAAAKVIIVSTLVLMMASALGLIVHIVK